MANTYTLIASTTVGAGGASSIDFTSIPSTYTDLCVLVSARSTRAAQEDYVKVEFNGVNTNLSLREIDGNGSSAASSTDTKIYGAISAANATASTFGNTIIYMPNYAGSTNKSVSMDSVSENNATGALAQLTAGLWSNTSAITQITLKPNTGPNFAQYSTAYLYGIKNS